MIEEYIHKLRHGYPAIQYHESDIAQHVAATLCAMPENQWYNPAKSGNFTGWLYKVSRHLAYRYMEREGRETPKAYLADVGELAAASLPDQPTPNCSELRRRVEEAFGQPDAEVFRLRYELGEPIPAIALATGRSVAAIYKQLERLAERMRELGYGYFTGETEQ